MNFEVQSANRFIRVSSIAEYLMRSENVFKSAYSGILLKFNRDCLQCVHLTVLCKDLF